MVRFVYVHLRSIAEEIYVAKQFCSRLSTENAEVADSELIDENGAQPSSSELDGWKKIGKGEPGYKNETVIVTVSCFHAPTKACLFDEKRCGRVREQKVAVWFSLGYLWRLNDQPCNTAKSPLNPTGTQEITTKQVS